MGGVPTRRRGPGSGYANTTVTIPGGFWLASFGPLFLSLHHPCAQRAAVLGIVYSVLQGYCLGAISASFDAQTEGIVGAAVLATLGVFFAAWFLYATSLVRPTRGWPSSSSRWAACAALPLRLGLDLRLGLALQRRVSLRRHRGPADPGRDRCPEPVLDFAAVDAGARGGRPKELSGTWPSSRWYPLWLYVTILRLLALLTRNG